MNQIKLWQSEQYYICLLRMDIFNLCGLLLRILDFWNFAHKQNP